MGMMNNIHPCYMCYKECFGTDCVWQSNSGDDYCDNYDCLYEYEGMCKLGFATRCAMSTEFKGNENED